MNKGPEKISRRELLRAAVLAPAAGVMLLGIGRAADGRYLRLDLQTIRNAPSRVVPLNDAENISAVKLTKAWNGSICKPSLINQGSRPVRIKEVALFELTPSFHPETRIYGEGFQMLSQTGGTVSKPEDLGNYTDAKHYKMPIPEGARAFYGMMTLAGGDRKHNLLAFTSCRRFNGQFFLRDGSLDVVLDTEGLELRPGQQWQLEEFIYRSGPDRGKLLAELASVLNQNHPPLRFPSPPTGWCSWYCFGPRVTAEQVLENLDFIARNAPGLKYIQIDDGYQPAMGDWLETGKAFGGNVQGVLKQIRDRGFEPAIWVAPFIAEEKSNVFRDHPDWFVKDMDGKPLRSDKVTFGGWRSIKEKGAWYVLDGTNPAVQKHFENVFRTMRNEWGVTYFKLDANFWGAIHGGTFHDPNATRIEAYRRGMQAVLRGAGDGFILGCNHPIWASLGLIHGSRSSNDIKRSWDRVGTTAYQNLSRNWQNGRLWWNDPDALVLMGDLSPAEFQFHATAIYASGGMVLSGDDLTKISSERLSMLKKLLPPGKRAASFKDDTLRVGTMDHGRVQMVCVFNWEDSPKSVSVDLPRAAEITDFWTGERLGRFRGSYTVKDFPARNARLFIFT
jgi:alpha-galactosidase